MGWRYRKSISIGGTRINFSKSGVGFSYKFLGFGPRITHTAKGTTRTTWDIHGTGLSYVTETGGKKKTSKKQIPAKQKEPPKMTEQYSTQIIQSHVDKNVTAEDFLELSEFVKSVRTKNNWIIAGIVLFGLFSFYFWPFLFLLATMIYLKVKINDYGKVEVECPKMDPGSKNEKLQLVKKAINSRRLKGVNKIVSNVDARYSSGASNSIGFKPCTRVEKLPFPFMAKNDLVGIKMGAERATFLQDFLLYENGNDMVFLDYKNIQVELKASKFIEEGIIPADSKVIGYTYQYVNRDGSPDGRFANNRRIPICLYGDIIITSSNGLNMVVQFSDSSVFDGYFKEETSSDKLSRKNINKDNGSYSLVKESFGGVYDPMDPMVRKALEICLAKNKCSTALLQTYLGKGHDYVSNLVDWFEQIGVIGEENGNKPRKVLISSMEEFDKLLQKR